MYAKRATGVELLLFDARGRRRAGARHRRSTARRHRTGPYWHAFVPGIGAGQVVRLPRPRPVGAGARPAVRRRPVLLDPYGRGVAVPAGYRPRRARAGAIGRSMKSVVVDLSRYDWEGDRPLGPAVRATRSSTRPTSGASPPTPAPASTPARRGTYAGFIEHIPYLVDLGITAVELLPVFAFDARDAPGGPAQLLGLPAGLVLRAPRRVQQPAGRAGRGRRVPRPRQGAPPGRPRGHPRRRLQPHRRGRRRRADVLLSAASRTSEYYLLDRGDRSRYADYSGTGNTLDANEPIVRRMILDSLRYWVAEMHVDGFRFDLASVLSRDEDGAPVPRPPIIWDIETDPVLAGTKLIAEAWDAAGLYQVGSFAGDRWVEWNGRFRDDVRSFVKSDPGKTWAVAPAHPGSPDIYGAPRPRAPEDHQLRHLPRRVHAQRRGLVRPQAQRGQRRGQPRRQRRQPAAGTAASRARPTIRRSSRCATRQVKNLLTLELLVGRRADAHDGRRGPPDAARQQQRLLPGQRALRGSTGALVERHADLLRFCGGLIAARRRGPGAARRAGDVTLAELLERSRVELARRRASASPTRATTSRIDRARLLGRAPRAAPHPQRVLGAARRSSSRRPRRARLAWRRIVDTTLASPDDLAPAVDAPVVDGGTLPGRARGPSSCSPPRRPAGAAEATRGDRPGPDAARRGTRSGWQTRATSRRASTRPARGTSGAPTSPERAWGSVREDYSADGDAWSSFPHDHARSRAYRWNEDGMAGISDVFGRLNLASRCGTGRTRSSRSGCSG